MAPPFLLNRSSKGFFLVVEGAQIDWGGHANDSDYIIQEMLDFDRAIGKILEFAKEDGETLVIVTGDHETGGFAINPGSKFGDFIPAFTTDYHTGALIPVFAYGPGSGLFNGIFENTAIYEKIRLALQFDIPLKSPQGVSAHPAGLDQ
jgi:alkaline phosphatase